MKITRKLPLKPRGRADEKKHTTRDAIRAAYTNGPRLEVQVIPAKRDVDSNYAPKPTIIPANLLWLAWASFISCCFDKSSSDSAFSVSDFLSM